ncbi:hypothetical protein GCM10020358_64880 [Amorphoplanes nipponensis]|uniref:Uncharacterized protein n=1 Tax=Actinoplanes nipponensis TaxID=135950 RepID=A0A919MGC9_9ACTN|nr:hypothetical protein Ani05nite_19880 [Actinoplanes nipponensis]
MAWLLRAGDRVRALDLLDELGPYAGRLCLTPEAAPGGGPDPSTVWRVSAGAVAATLAGRDENPRVAAMHEAL